MKNVFRDTDSSSSKYFTGDIFRQIRISTRCGDTVRRQKWLGRLTTNQKKDVRRLEVLPPIFMNTLDALTSFAGLWPFMHIGKFKRVSALHCPEVRDSPVQIIAVVDDAAGIDPLPAKNNSDVDSYTREPRR